MLEFWYNTSKVMVLSWVTPISAPSCQTFRQGTFRQFWIVDTGVNCGQIEGVRLRFTRFAFGLVVNVCSFLLQHKLSTPMLLTYATKRGTLAVGSPFTKISCKNFLEGFENAASVQTHEIMNLTTDLLPIVLFYDE